MQVMTIKIMAGCLLSICGLLAGRALSSSTARRVKELNALRDALSPLESKMLGELLPLSDALRAMRHETLTHVADLMEQKPLSVKEAWAEASDKAFSRSGTLDCLTKEDRAQLDSFFSELGMSGRAEQKALIERTRDALKILHDDALVRAKETGKLYSTLGALAGMALAIALL